MILMQKTLPIARFFYGTSEQTRTVDSLLLSIAAY